MVIKSLSWGCGQVAQISKSVNALVAKGSGYQPNKLEKRVYATLLLLGAMQRQASAQGGAQAALEGVQRTVIGIVQVVFAIVLVIGLVRVVMKFINNQPDALGSLGWLMGGVIIWFGFQVFKDDLVGAVGGGPGGVE